MRLIFSRFEELNKISHYFIAVSSERQGVMDINHESCLNIKTMVRFLLLLLFSSLFAFVSQTWGNTNPHASFAEAFQAGIKHYQEQKYAEALAHFDHALEFQPRSAAALYNKSLAAFKNNDKGLALGLLRQVLALDPQNDQAQQALSYSLSQLNPKEIPHQISTFENIRTYFLNSLSLRSFLALHVLTLLVFGWLFLIWLSRRKSAAQKNEPTPSAGFGLSLSSIAFIFISVALAAKLYDSTLVRATILPAEVKLKVTPNNESPDSITLHQGFEVIVEQTHEGWAQVTYPGAQTGWLEKNALLMTDLD